MANEISVDVKINGLDQNTISIKNLTDALNGLAKPAKQTQEGLKKTEDSILSLANKGFGKLAAVAAASIASVAALFAGKEIIQAAIEQENSINGLNLTLQSLGIYSKETSDELQAFADQLQKTTKFSDDQVISSINLIGALTTLDKDGLKQATQASLDLASTLKLDVDSASKLIAKGIAGNTEQFKRYGIEVKKGASESENLTNILEALSRQQGRSQADLNTFSGALAFVSNGFGELLASIGDVIIKDPLINKFILKLGEGLFFLADNVKNASLSITDFAIDVLSALSKIENGFDSTITIIAIWAKEVQIKFTEVGLFFAELRSNLESGFISLNEKFSALFGVQTKKINIDTSSVDQYKSKLTGLNTQVDVLLKKVNDLGEGRTGGFFFKQTEDLKKLREEIKKTQDSFSNNNGRATAKSFIDTDAIKKEFESLYKSLEGLDKGETGRLEAEFRQREAIIKKYIAQFGDAEGKGSQALLALTEDTNKKRAEIEKKALEERIKLRQEEVNRIKANPIGDLLGFNKKITEQIDLVITPKVQGLVEGFGEAFAKGKEGAKNLLVSATSGAIDAILPGVGSAIKPFLDVFAQGPEATQKMVEEFLGAVPQFVTNLIRSVPAFIQTIIRETPKIVNQLVQEVPKVIQEFLKSIPTIINEFVNSVPSIINALVIQLPFLINQLALQMPFIAFSFVEALIKNIPYLISQTVNALIQGIKDQIKGIFGGGGDDDGLLGIGFLGLADGGKIVRGGIAGKDSVPAAVMPGELIVDQALTKKMQDYFDGSGGQGNDVTNALLVNVIDLLSRPQEIQTSVQVNSRTFADIMINLSRINARTVA